MAILDVTPQKHFLGFHTGGAAARDPTDPTSRRYTEGMDVDASGESERLLLFAEGQKKLLLLLFWALHVLC
jgi:hypothetical protein